MSSTAQPSPHNAAALEVDIELRIGLDVWTQVLRYSGGGDESRLASLLRLIYGLGYYDALIEPERGQLCKDNGFAVPERRRPRLPSPY